MILRDTDISFTSPFDKLRALFRMTCFYVILRERSDRRILHPNQSSFRDESVDNLITGKGSKLGFRETIICAQRKHDPLNTDVLRSQMFFFPGICLQRTVT